MPTVSGVQIQPRQSCLGLSSYVPSSYQGCITVSGYEAAIWIVLIIGFFGVIFACLGWAAAIRERRDSFDKRLNKTRLKQLEDESDVLKAQLQIATDELTLHKLEHPNASSISAALTLDSMQE